MDLIALYIPIILLLAGLLIIYFRIAAKFLIIDKPNERSLHNIPTIRGGGIVFVFAVITAFVLSDFQYPYFVAGFILISTISFVDDVKTIPNNPRLISHFLAFVALTFQTSLIAHFGESIWLIPTLTLVFVVGIGVLNAYNFMDGINGITGLYSLLLISTLGFFNRLYYPFIDEPYIFCAVSGLLVFNFFNTRTQARCFAGDVGSISIAFFVIFALLNLILASQNFVFIMLISVYGVETVLTISHRLMLKENIFKAHRMHLYQWLVHRKGISHLQMSSIYTILQCLINIIIIFSLSLPVLWQTAIALFTLCLLTLSYILIKSKLSQKNI